MKRSMQGFTLVEISVILLALGLILPGAIVFWQLSERQRVTTVQVDVQQQTRDALVGYLHSNYRLPCPAADTAGVESCTEGGGLRQVGFVPWRTLGLPGLKRVLCATVSTVNHRPPRMKIGIWPVRLTA